MASCFIGVKSIGASLIGLLDMLLPEDIIDTASGDLAGDNLMLCLLVS